MSKLQQIFCQNLCTTKEKNKMYSMKKILKLLSQKYPTNYTKGMNPVIVIYDDESGRIIKDAQEGLYEGSNLLFSFSTIKELVKHLQS